MLCKYYDLATAEKHLHAGYVKHIERSDIWLVSESRQSKSSRQVPWSDLWTMSGGRRSIAFATGPIPAVQEWFLAHGLLPICRRHISDSHAFYPALPHRLCPALPIQRENVS